MSFKQNSSQLTAQIDATYGSQHLSSVDEHASFHLKCQETKAKVAYLASQLSSFRKEMP